MKTRDRILSAALDLFNASGTASVSTNHIAEALGMSPGNLYYHYRNKEAIIRGLFEQLFGRWDDLFALPPPANASPGRPDAPPSLADLLALVEANFGLLWEYRFVYRELIALLRRDPVLQERFVAVRERGYAGFRELFAQFAAAGVLRQADDAAIANLTDLCWLITESWLPTAEWSGRDVDAAHIRRGADLMVHVLKPYIVAAALVRRS